MLPNMFKIAGELTPTVIHVAARTVATHALSIFGDHSDVMSARTTGWTMLASGSPQEAHDLAAVSHAATLVTRVPVLHFFDGFRTSHELGAVVPLADDDLVGMLDAEAIRGHRQRGLTPDAPVLRGSAQNPDVFFQAREAANPFHEAVPGAVQRAMDDLAERTGRRYHLVEYHGASDAERVVVVMGSGAATVRAVVDHLCEQGEKVGVITVRLFRPFPVEEFLDALPETVRRVAVLDRTKEPGAVGEPLLTDVTTVLAEAAVTGRRDVLVDVAGGRYGLSSKEFTPAMAAAVYRELDHDRPRRRFTVGIVDDVTRLSLNVDADFALPRPEGSLQAVFFGLGSDGTVGANKNTVKIIAEHTDLHPQGYFVYDSKKSGATTESHLRFSPEPVDAPYLIEEADLVACHQFGLLEKLDVLAPLRNGGTALLNVPFDPSEVVDRLPSHVVGTLAERGARVLAIDAYRIAREAGIPGRINTVMQVAFFEASGLLPAGQAREAIEAAAAATYAELGRSVVERNLAAIRAAAGALVELDVGPAPTGDGRSSVVERAQALRGAGVDPPPDFVTKITDVILAGDGDRLPVSALPVDGTFPTGTARWEKRTLAEEVPVWDPDICIDCGKCAIVCPHAAIQIKIFEPGHLEGAPETFKSKSFRDRDLGDHLLTVQVAPDDCTGCGVCVESCPAVSRSEVGHKAIDMTPVDELLDGSGGDGRTGDEDAVRRTVGQPTGGARSVDEPGRTVRDVERERFAHFEAIPYPDRDTVRHDTVKHSQTLQPLFEFSGACAGCGETPYLKLLSQLFGDRSVIANATGCSSIYGGNLPTTPWGTDAAGRGPAWSNSLFEDNAEFGLGIRLGLDEQREVARHLLRQLAADVGDDLVDELLRASQSGEAEVAVQRERVVELRRRLGGVDGERAELARHLDVVADALVRRDVWIVGGDGWAYDIGFGGLDHVLASGADVNILVLDTEVYSNTGGQASKATPRAAVAKFATSGKGTPKKDLGLLAMQYGTVYVAQVAMGANEMQTVKAFHEAEAWPGPSLLLAYSTCIAHGVDMRYSMQRMDLAVKTGYWPLFRFHPAEGAQGRPFRLDSKAPSEPLEELLRTEARYAVLETTDPERAAALRALAQGDVDERWRYYEQLAGVERTPGAAGDPVAAGAGLVGAGPGDGRASRPDELDGHEGEEQS
jgi:pyruvate-ferredoxin/flavodoxin oxidoreductase